VDSSKKEVTGDEGGWNSRQNSEKMAGGGRENDCGEGGHNLPAGVRIRSCSREWGEGEENSEAV